MRRFLCALLLGLLLCPANAYMAGDAPIHHVDYRDAGALTLGQDDLLEVHFINVAAADCILLRMGNETLMIDSGKRGTSDRIFAYLDRIGVDRLDYAFLTHPHDDHLGGYIDVLAQIPTGVFLANSDYFTDTVKLTQTLRTVVGEQGIPEQLITSGHRMDFGTATITFYQWDNPSVGHNDRSMVALLEYGGRSVLFAADNENKGQKALAELYGNALHAEILKMPHHGINAFTRELYESVMPTLITYSNTKSNIQTNLNAAKRWGLDWMLVTKGPIVAITEGDSWIVWQIPNAAL